MTWDTLFHKGQDEFRREHGQRPTYLYASAQSKYEMEKFIKEIGMPLFERKEKTDLGCDAEYAGVKIIWVLRKDWFKFHA